jgi:hypothetical protein
MAQKVITSLIDDIDGTEAVETVTFSLDGVAYEIDLSEVNAKTLREDLASWTGHARQAGRSRRIVGDRKAARADVLQIRKWAQGNGHQVKDRGRIPADLVKAYDAAH